MQPINIPLSKKKIVLLIVGSILFVVAGIWMFVFKANHQTHYNPLFIKIVSIASVVFFGASWFLVL
ncbi:MAG: hypothetical protein QM541_07775 [Flavobacterium sp.]|nr:hypothetical protein [Flavobacterium sp.]